MHISVCKFVGKQINDVITKNITIFVCVGRGIFTTMIQKMIQ